jgi:hypothetical protein
LKKNKTKKNKGGTYQLGQTNKSFNKIDLKQPNMHEAKMKGGNTNLRKNHVEVGTKEEQSKESYLSLSLIHE